MSEHREKKRDKVPTVSRVCGDTLIELVYDPDKRKTALAVSRFNGLWNIEQEVMIETGEVLIPYAATNSLIANRCVLLPSAPTEYGFKHELIADIRSFLHRYVDLSPAFETVAAYYVLMTWVHDAFGEVPYLRARGDYGSGKTRCLMTIGSLCYKPFFASGASSSAALFRTLDAFGGTLVLDEADMPFSDAKAELVKILNNGTVKGMPVLRTVVNRHKEFNPYAFQVFGPKIIGAREPFQDRALESRFLTEITGTRRLRSDIPIHLPPTFEAEALALRNRLLHFRLCEFFRIKTDTGALMKGAEPRLNQMALSLLSMVDDAEARKELQHWILEQYSDLQNERRETPEALVLTATLHVFGLDGAFVRDIARRFNQDAETVYGSPVSNKWIGSILRTRLHLVTSKTNGVYIVPASEKPKLDALALRYGFTPHATTTH